MMKHVLALAAAAGLAGCASRAPDPIPDPQLEAAAAYIRSKRMAPPAPLPPEDIGPAPTKKECGAAAFRFFEVALGTRRPERTLWSDSCYEASWWVPDTRGEPARWVYGWRRDVSVLSPYGFRVAESYSMGFRDGDLVAVQEQESGRVVFAEGAFIFYR